MPCPRATHLEQDLAVLAERRVDRVVSLLETEEAAHLGLAEEAAACHRLGMDFTSFPVRDMHPPPNLRKFRQLSTELYEELRQGRNILIHCYAGIGRTGVLSGSILIRSGMSPRDAIELMSTIRGRNMPQTQEQYDFLLAEADPPAAERQTPGRFSWLWKRRQTA
ncbi:MAG: dual specificity protein phosphatase family protein [Thiothrix sp.]|nr:dual specificity protein phosphatase family protein [Thiothrix sp.]HPQ96180.1 dual specificity protein phosphatase family protein [Thiolinea sp.]